MTRLLSQVPVLRRGAVASALALLVMAAAAGPAGAQGLLDPNACDAPGDAPDVIVGDLHQLNRYGHVGDITAFSVGTYSCNVGTCWLDWITGAGSNRHPTIGQNLFRLKSGRFEQVGQSWLKHGFYALSNRLCNNDCQATDGEHLGVNCFDPYSADLNGQQNRLGPKFEVNVATGGHLHPVSMQAQTGNEIFKRLQVHDADLDPALNAGALYFIEGQYIAQDDRAAGNHHNNASYRKVRVSTGGPANFDIAFDAPTVRTKPGILAWSDNDPTVLMKTVDDADGGRYFVGAKATDLGGGMWHYEYAIHNLDSQRAAGWYSVPIPVGATATNVGFHDVDYHSGEPFDLIDWTNNGGGGGKVFWGTEDFATNPDANALRWGTLYNFRFDCNRPPTTELVTLGMFKPRAPGESDRLVVETLAPSPCNGNGACDSGESCVACALECPNDAGPDSDGDSSGFCEDCNDNAPGLWATPGEVRLLMARRGPTGEVIMSWQTPSLPGATLLEFEALRSNIASDFATNSLCLRGTDRTQLGVTDMGAATSGPLLNYLARARNTCARGLGTTGGNSFGVERIAAICP